MIRYFLAGIAVLSFSFSPAQEAWTLEKCITHAMENNIQVRQSALNADVSEIQMKQSRLNLLPSLNAGASHGYNWGQSIDPFTNTFANDRVRNNSFFLSTGVTLFNGFQLQNAVKQSKLDYEAGLLDVAELKNVISTNIAQSYLNVLFNQEIVRVNVSQVDISEQQVDRMRRMVEVGQEASVTLYDIESQYAADQLSLTTAENNLSIAKVGLMTLLQLSFDQTQTFEVSTPDTEALDMTVSVEDLATLYQSALSKLPQVKAAETRVNSSAVAYEIAKGGRSPNINLSGSLGSGYSGNNIIGVGDLIVDQRTIGAVETTGQAVVAPDFSFGAFETKAFGEQLDDNFNQSLSLSLNIPIFNGYQVSSNIQRAQIQRDIAHLQYEGVKNQLFQEVQQAHANTLAALKQYQAADQALRSVQLNFTNAEKRFEQSMLNTVDFNDAKNRLTRTESEMIRAKYEYLFRRTILDFYNGQPIKL